MREPVIARVIQKAMFEARGDREQAIQIAERMLREDTEIFRKIATVGVDLYLEMQAERPPRGHA